MNQQLAEKLDDAIISSEDFFHIARLAIAGQGDDVRLFVAKMVRLYREDHPDFAEKLEKLLKGQRQARSTQLLRRMEVEPQSLPVMPTDADSRLSLFKRFEDTGQQLAPLLNASLQQSFAQLIKERQQIQRLHELGLNPSRSAIFLGPPGVGKTLTARWLASQLGV